jgi:chemotaxis protein methyltransferase CheR
VTSAKDYRFLSDLLGRNSGLHLGEGKEYLLESRLAPIAAQFDLPDVSALVRRMREGTDSQLVLAAVEAMTTQETLFFRDTSPFKALKESVLPALLAVTRASRRKLRIWSAACSTGQEPYSIAMLLATLLPAVTPGDVEIVATDYSAKALARARTGLYSQFEVQRGLPAHLLIRFFAQTPAGIQLSDEIRRWVTFHEHNLLQSPGPFGSFDVIFCRNVLIYFDRLVKREVFDRLAQALMPGGSLFLGAAESPFGITDRLVGARCECPGVYVHADHRAPSLAAPAVPDEVPAACWLSR